MPLTPQDVRNKLFTPVRFKPGYDEDEVDAFLDEVETELTRLYVHIEELDGLGGPGGGADVARIQADADERLRAALEEAEARSAAEIANLRAEADAQLRAVRSQQAGDGGPDEAAERIARAEEQVQQLRAQLQQVQATAAQQVQQAEQEAARAQEEAAAAEAELARLRSGQPETGPDQPAPAVTVPEPLPPPSPTEELLRRTLILAQRTADEAIAEARAEAERLVGGAKSDAERLLGSARSEAENLVGSARSEADNLVGSARSEAERTERTAAAQHAENTRRREAEHKQAVERSRAEHELLVSRLEELRSFERDYRSRLRAYLHLQLRDLEAAAPGPPAALGGLRTAIGTGPADAGDEPESAGIGLEPKPGPGGVVDHAGADAPLRPAPLYGDPAAGDR